MGWGWGGGHKLVKLSRMGSLTASGRDARGQGYKFLQSCHLDSVCVGQGRGLFLDLDFCPAQYGSISSSLLKTRRPLLSA